MAVLQGLLVVRAGRLAPSVLAAVTLALALLAVSLGTILAVGPAISLTPSSGPRDDGVAPTAIHIVGTFDYAGAIRGPDVYWDVQDGIGGVHRIYAGTGFSAGAAFDITVDVPVFGDGVNLTRPGNHTIIVCGTSGRYCDHSISASFKVLPPKIVLGRASGRPGESISVAASRFVPEGEEEVRAFFGPSKYFEDYPPGSVFDVPFTVPALPPGQYTVKVCQADLSSDAGCVAKDLATAKFTITQPKLHVVPGTGLSGDSFDVSGSGFFVKRSLHLYFGPVGKAPTDPSVVEIRPSLGKSTDGKGDFGVYSYAPVGGPGKYDVTACTFDPLGPGRCDPADTVSVPYEITSPGPSPTPTPTPSASPSASPVASPSPTPSASPSPGASATPTPSVTRSATATPAPSAPATATPQPAPTASPTEAAPPTAAPSPTPEVLSWPEHLGAPGEKGRGVDPATLATMSLLALLIAFLAPFPGTLFNKTVEANYEEIRGWVAGARRRWHALLDALAVGPLAGLKRWLARLPSGRAGVLVFIGLSALVYGFLSPTFGLDGDSVGLFLGLLVGLLLVTATFELPLRLYHGRRSQGHDQGVLHALWWTLLVAVICVVMSRLADFQPGYLYGLIVAIVFATEITPREEGIGNWLASLWLLVLSFAAWFLLSFVRQGELDPWLSLFLQTVLVTFVVAGIETLAVGLLPMRFMPGHPVFRWRRAMWIPLFALAIFGYLLILVDPANGYLSDDSRTPMIIGIIFLVVFGAVSIGTWAYFRFRPVRPGEDRPGEAPSA